MTANNRDLSGWLANELGPVILQADGEDITPRGKINFVNATFTDTEPNEATEPLGMTTITLGGAGNVTDNEANFGEVDEDGIAPTKSFVLKLVTNDSAPGQGYNTTFFAIPEGTVVDCVGTALVVDLTDNTVDLIDFREQFQRAGASTAVSIGTPDNNYKISSGGDQQVQFQLSSNDLTVRIDAAAGDVRHWTITMQLQITRT